MPVPFLQMKNISKTFPGVKALDKVSLDVSKGEVLAVCGENGAGKSTLMKVLTGVHKPDYGSESQILINGEPVQINDPIHARSYGINIIYQEMATIWNLTVAENIFLSREPLNQFGMIDWQRMNREAKQYLDRLGVDIDVKAKISDLSVGQQQMVEIAKAISYESTILIMDEPTASLSYNETKTLLRLIRELKERGQGLVYISHRLEEVFEIADRITILRDGKTVDCLDIKDATHEILVKKMVDRELSDIYTKTGNYSTEEVLLKVENLGWKKKNPSGGLQIGNISFELRKGEILGISGLIGAGRTEIMNLIFGALPSTGKIFIKGEEVAIKKPSDAIVHGIGYVTEDRKGQGLVLMMNVLENISLASLPEIQRKGTIDFKLEKKICKDLISKLRIKTPNARQIVYNLSGGNQQKVVIAKWLAKKPSILIVDEPTRGIDIGAKSEIHEILQTLAKQGVGIIVVSSELPEILAISDRILVISNGAITGEFSQAEATQEKILERSVNVY